MPAPSAPAHEQMCEWFLLCENPATREIMHPIIGAVPTCERCATIALTDKTTLNTHSAAVSSSPEPTP